MKKKFDKLEEIKNFELEDNSKKSLYIELSIIVVVVILALIVIGFCSVKLYKEYKQMNQKNEEVIKGNITVDSVPEVQAKVELQGDVVVLSLNVKASDVYKISVYQDSNLILQKSFIGRVEETTKTYSFTFTQDYNYMVKIETVQ